MQDYSSLNLFFFTSASSVPAEQTWAKTVIASSSDKCSYLLVMAWWCQWTCPHSWPGDSDWLLSHAGEIVCSGLVNSWLELSTRQPWQLQVEKQLLGCLDRAEYPGYSSRTFFWDLMSVYSITARMEVWQRKHFTNLMISLSPKPLGIRFLRG